ncbi:MAG: hypothetical protein ACR2QE_01910 [Acidimicrobiales bacterium]
MNHERMATEALRFRATTLRPTLVDTTSFDVERAAAVAVSSADPVIDTALRAIGDAWAAAGLSLDEMARPWDRPRVHELFVRRPDLLDALDDIVCQVRRHTPCR